jgi:excisionase family DNA binding protein
MENDERLVLSIDEAARKLGISRESAYRAAKNGELPTIKIGSLLRVPKIKLDRFVNGESAK